jgi:hypothetical protein
MKSVHGLVVCFALALAAAPLQAQGVLFIEKETRGGQSTTNRIQLGRDHMRAESRATGEEMAFVFDGQKQTARMINMSKKSYMEITKADMDQMGKQMNSAMAQMQAQLQSMPPAQRAMIEQMMQGRGMPGMPGMPGMATPPKVEYKQAGTDKVGQWSCTKYEGSVGGQKTTEVCTVDPKEFGLGPADFGIARQFAEFIRGLAPQDSERLLVNGSIGEQGFAGVPVRRTSYRNGAVESVSEITEFRKETFPPATFEVPAGFRKEAMPGMPGR